MSSKQSRLHVINTESRSNTTMCLAFNDFLLLLFFFFFFCAFISRSSSCYESLSAEERMP